MKNMTAHSGSDRFQSGADKYAAYLDTPEGRLRIDLALANLHDCLPQNARSLRVLDLGGGTGANAVRLARLGYDVTVLDSSPPMLEFAERAAREAGVTERIVLKHGDATEIANLFHSGSFDVILCHNILEFVDNPCALLCDVAGALRDSSAILSILVRNRAGEVFKAAMLLGDLAMAEHNLTAESAEESLYGGKTRLFAPDDLKAMLKTASLNVMADFGVRVMSDYLPPQVSRKDQYEDIFALERKLGRRPDFAAVARYTHCLARREGPVKDSR